MSEDFPGCESENRCRWCCKFFKRPQDLKGHLTKGCAEKPKRQHIEHNTNSKSGKAVKRMKQVEAQKQLEHVLIGEIGLENVYDFPYLGHHFQADGNELHAVEVRLAMHHGIDQVRATPSYLEFKDPVVAHQDPTTGLQSAQSSHMHMRHGSSQLPQCASYEDGMADI